MSVYYSLDVETANADYSSICQIGIAKFVAGEIESRWSSFVDPKTYFDPYNVGIHGITSDQVTGAPSFQELYSTLSQMLSGSIVVHHGHFDRTAFARCYDRFEVEPIVCDWLDNTKVVRRTWDEFKTSGYGLKNLVDRFGIELDHHDALSDAVAAGRVFGIASEVSGKTAADWLEKLRQRVYNAQDFRREGDSEAPFFGEKIVFTGALDVSRAVAADVAQKLGFDVQNGVTRKTTYLCVGLQDLTTLAGHSKSSKHRKAEALASGGQEISILSEDDFWTLAKIHSTGEVE